MFKNKNGCFDCDKCPKNNDKSKGRFCVAWLEVQETNHRTGESRFVRDCGIPQLFKIMIQNTAAADRVTENLTSLPGKLLKTFPPREIKRINGS